MKSVYDNYKPRSLSGEQTKWQGFWITSERFYHLPACRQYGYDRKPQFNSKIQNIHTFYKKDFDVKEKEIKRAKLFVSADDLYKLYLNGSFVGEGPAQSYPFAYNYNCYDVTELLQGGENAIAIHVYYQGLFNIYLMSADNLSGMIAQLEVEYEDGDKQLVVSDGSWSYSECDAYTQRYLYGYQTQFSEDIDLSKLNKGWRDIGFDTSDWSRAIIAARPYPLEYTLVPQITPSVTHEKIYPAEIKRLDNGYFFDFGKEITGVLVAELKGCQGDAVELRFGEELDGEGRVRFELRANCTYRDIITLSGGDDQLEYYDYKGYRFAEILDAPEDFDPARVYTFARHYPYPSTAAKFNCSDDMINKIWEICEHGVKIGTQETYYDCPTREKGGFVGDALITGLSHLLLTGDERIYKKFIFDLDNTSRYCPAVMAHLPTYNINICADYSSLVALFLEEYYNYSGNKELLLEMLPIVEGVWAYYSQFLNSDGLLEDVRHMKKVPYEMEPVLIDWPQNLRDGYDMERARTGVSTTINMFFYGMLKTAARLYRIVGNEVRVGQLEEIYQRMGKSMISVLYNGESGLFVDAEGSEHSSIHANALQLFFGLEPPRGYAPIKDMIVQKGLNCGVYFAYFVIEGLYRAGYSREAYSLLTGDGEHSWKNMVNSGATTCMEAWGPDQKWNTSWCHPWSSSPIYFFTSRVMGIRLEGVGEKKLYITPYLEGAPDKIKLELPLPEGRVLASYEYCNGKRTYSVKAPDAYEIIFKGEDVDFIRS